MRRRALQLCESHVWICLRAWPTRLSKGSSIITRRCWKCIPAQRRRSQELRFHNTFLQYHDGSIRYYGNTVAPGAKLQRLNTAEDFPPRPGGTQPCSRLDPSPGPDRRDAEEGFLGKFALWAYVRILYYRALREPRLQRPGDLNDPDIAQVDLPELGGGARWVPTPRPTARRLLTWVSVLRIQHVICGTAYCTADTVGEWRLERRARREVRVAARGTAGTRRRGGSTLIAAAVARAAGGSWPARGSGCGAARTRARLARGCPRSRPAARRRAAPPWSRAAPGRP